MHVIDLKSTAPNDYHEKIRRCFQQYTSSYHRVEFERIAVEHDQQHPLVVVVALAIGLGLGLGLGLRLELGVGLGLRLGLLGLRLRLR
jgi:hypothetical protein